MKDVGVEGKGDVGWRGVGMMTWPEKMPIIFFVFVFNTITTRRRRNLFFSSLSFPPTLTFLPSVWRNWKPGGYFLFTPTQQQQPQRRARKRENVARSAGDGRTDGRAGGRLVEWRWGLHVCAPPATSKGASAAGKNMHTHTHTHTHKSVT